MQLEKSEKQRILLPILRILIALILIGKVSTWAAIDSSGRNKTARNEESQILLSKIRVFDVVGGVFREAQDMLIEGILHKLTQADS